MRLQELTTKEAVRFDEVTGKRVRFFLQSSFYELNGTWHWEMETDAVFCSDVMLSLPGEFAGTKAIFHPDDVAALKEKLSVLQTINFLEFRIITTYGEVKTVTGENITVTEDEKGLEAWQEQTLQSLFQQQEGKATRAHLQMLKEIGERTSRFSQSGTWYYNASTNQTWYADFVFKLHGLPPQGLNAHLHTFHPFIHPEDREQVTEFMDRAYRDKAPLHLDYRIVIADQERWVGYKAHWFYGENGEAVLGGIFEDITEQKTAEREIEAYKNLVQFQRQQLLYDEQQVAFGHWQVNLLTRKTTYSDQYYRIFGVKPGSTASTITSFLNYIHPDDRDNVEAAYKKLIYEHAVPDLEYRIVRADGKMRYILQKAKLLFYEQELIVSGIIQDVTVQRMLEKKVAGLNEQLLQKAWVAQQGDDVSNSVSWVMDIDENTFQWSESFYKLVGYLRNQPQNITEKTLFTFVHPHDLKAFRKRWEEAVQQRQAAAFEFRTMQRGSVHYMKAVFTHQTLNEKIYFTGTLQDTTGEHVLQQQLSQRVQLAESLTENILDRVMITDSNNTILLWNRACEEAYGLKKAEAIGQNFFDVFPHLKTEEEMQLFQKVQRGEKVVLEGAQSALGNGYYNLYLMPLYQDTEVTGVLHVINDVTKETELRNSLNDRLQLIESIVQSSVDRIIALDRNMNYLYWNRKAEEYYGLPKEAVVGKNILEVFPRLVNDPSYGEIRKALKGETVHLPMDAEQERYFETNIIPIKNGKGEVTSVVWMAHDLTKEMELQQEQQKAQQQLSAEHHRMKEAQAIGHTGSFEWIASTDTIYWSDEMYRIHGLEPQSEIITLDKLLSFIPPGDAENSKEKIIQCRKEACAIELIHSIKRTDGEVRIVRRQLQSYADENGTVTHLSGTLQDVTEQKNAEQQLIRLKDELAQKATDKYLTLFNSIDEGFYLAEVIFDENNRPVDIFYHEENPAAVRILGVSVKGKKLTEISPDYEKYWYETFGSVALTGESQRMEQYAKHDDKWFNFYVTKIGDESSRQIAIVFYDNTEHKRREAHTSFLAEVTEEFSGLSSPDEIMQRVGEKIGTYMKVDNCSFVDIDESAEKQMIPTYNWFSSGLRRFPEAFRIKDYLTEEFERACRAGETIVVSNTKTDSRTNTGGYDALRVNAFITVPFFQAGEWKHFLAVSCPDPRDWRTDEIELFQELANIVFHRLEKARAEEALHQSEERKAFLLKLSDALRPLSDPGQIQAAATRIAMNYFGADRCYYCEIENDTAFIRQEASKEGLPSVAASYPLSTMPIFKTVLDAGRPFVVPDSNTTDLMDEGLKQLCIQMQILSYVNVPVSKLGQPAGFLCLTQSTPRTWTASEVELVEEVAERVWSAVERAKAEDAIAADLRDMQILQKLSEHLVSEDNMAVIYRQIIDAAITLTAADAGTVQLFDEETQDLVLLATKGLEKNVTDHFARVNAGSNTSCGTALANKERAFVDFDVPETEDPDGSLRLHLEAGFLSAQSTPLISRSGKPIGMVSTHWRHRHRPTERELRFLDLLARQAADLLEQRQAQEALQVSEEKYRSLFETMDEGFTVCELVRDEEGKVIDWLYLELNNAWEKQIGISREQALQKRARQLMPDLEDWWCQVFGQVVSTGEPARFDHYVAPLNRWYHFIVFPQEGQKFAAIYDDITLRKQTEEQLKNFNLMLKQQVEERTYDLQESKELLQSVFDASLHGIILFKAIRNKEGNITDYEVVLNNAVTEKWNGRSLVGKLYGEEFPHIRQYGIFEAYNKVLETGEPMQMEVLYEGEGFKNWFTITAVKLDDDELVATAEDITERKKAESEIEKNITILKQAEDIAAIGSWEYQIPSGRFSWSDGMYRIFDYPMGAPVQPEIYVHHAIEEDRGIAKRIVKNLKKNNQPFEEYLRIKSSTGVRHLKVKGTVVPDEKGAPQRIIGVDMDVTDVVQAQEQVKQSQYWLEQTAKASPDSITIYDLQKKQPIYLNNCLAEWVGTTTDELTAMGIDGRLQLVHPDDRLRLLHFNEKLKAANDGQVLTLEYRLSTKHDVLLWIHNRSKVFQRNAQGEVTHILSILQDVTEEKAAERVLKSLNASLEKKNQELETKNEEITSFAFVASHDLKEPLRKIRTFSDWLLTKEPLLSDTGKQSVEKMVSSVKRLDLLINDILALTKIHVGNDKVKTVDLNLLLQQLKEEMHERLQHTGAVIEAGVLPGIAGAENQLFYLFKNLISNAIKFQPKGNVPLISIKAETEGPFVKISVSDNGLGIAAEHHKKIFEMFRRLHSREAYEGTGMGLSICKKIMEKHGGKITVESAPGNGSTFTCWFPAVLSTNTES